MMYRFAGSSGKCSDSLGNDSRSWRIVFKIYSYKLDVPGYPKLEIHGNVVV